MPEFPVVTGTIPIVFINGVPIYSPGTYYSSPTVVWVVSA